MAGTFTYGVQVLEANDLQDDSVTGSKIAQGAIEQTIIAGAAAGDHTVTGIATVDKLVSVLFVDFTDASETGTDQTSEYTISAADTINNGGGTSSAGGFLIVMYINVA